MRMDTISLQRAYFNGNVNNPGLVGKSRNIASTEQGMDSTADGVNSGRNKRIITGAERKFFVNMFPESSKQLMTHEVFNRSGKLQSQTVSKGSIIDGRI